jgi:hypothetical protein
MPDWRLKRQAGVAALSSSADKSRIFNYFGGGFLAAMEDAS